MAVAKVSIASNGPASFHGLRHLKKGETLTITDPAEIRYFQRAFGIKVEVVEGAKAEKKSSAAAAAVAENDDEGDDDEVTPIPSKKELEKMTKVQLIAFASDALGLDIGMDLTKSKLIEAILESESEEDDEEEGEEDEDE